LKKKKEKKVLITTGKKKTAVARAVFKEGSGNIRINRRSINTVEPKIIREWILEPLYLAKEVLGEDALQSIDININVRGGGFSGQAQACRTDIGKGLLALFEDKIEELRKLFE
jgi:small subunit ribosomal protein S9